MGFALQGFFPFTKPSTIHHRRTTLLPLLPLAALLWFLGQSTFGRVARHPSMKPTPRLSDYRVFVLVKISRSAATN
jgi:hypothetical protein